MIQAYIYFKIFNGNFKRAYKIIKYKLKPTYCCKIV